MRINKYKIHKNKASADWKLPWRVWNFKRPKWESIKKKLYNRYFNKKRGIRKRIGFVNHIKIGVERRKFIVKKFFKTKQQSKKYLSSLFENSIDFKKHNTNKDRLSSTSFNIIKPLFRIDLLLWYLKIFSSSVEARAFINGRNILVNDVVVTQNYELKMGDVISIKYFNMTAEVAERNEYYLIWDKFKNSRAFFPFLEFDYYANKIVVIKDWNQLSKSDLALTIKFNKKLKYAF